MPRLPIPGSDNGTWGDLLNEFLTVSHDNDGTLKHGSVASSQLQANSVTSGKLSTSNSPTSGQFLSYDGANMLWAASAGTGVTDHGALTGLSDDDHPQYLNNARGDARYYTQGQIDTALNSKADTSHTQAASTITDLTEATQDIIGASVVAGSNVTVTYNDTTGATTVAAAASPVTSVATKTGDVTLVKADVGLANVDDTSDASKPISNATQTALNAKANATHAHAIADVTNLQASLDGKAATSHAHSTADLTGTVPIAKGGTNATDAATARTNLAVPQAAGFAKITVGTTQPVSPSVGDLWVDTN